MMGFSRTIIIFIAIQIIQTTIAQEEVKRAPQGFLGMRGKKYIDSEELEHFYKRKPQFFIGVKGKKSINDYILPDEYYKRAPMGFVGMRGKKNPLLSDVFYYPGFETLPKKGALIGEIDYAANEELNSQPNFPILNELMAEYLHKLEQGNAIDNAPGFEDTTGLPDDMLLNELEKKANMNQFYGVRGKKFRGKFIGVRGKKAIKNSAAQEIKVMLNKEGPWPKRKSQMGFFGMRGKKWNDDESSTEVETTN